MLRNTAPNKREGSKMRIRAFPVSNQHIEEVYSFEEVKLDEH